MHDIHLLLAGTFVCNFYFLSSLAPDGCSTAAVVGSASECRELRGGGKELRDTALSSSCWAFPFSPLLRWAALLLPSAPRDNQRWKLLDKVQKREKTKTRREREEKFTSHFLANPFIIHAVAASVFPYWPMDRFSPTDQKKGKNG